MQGLRQGGMRAIAILLVYSTATARAESVPGGSPYLSAGQGYSSNGTGYGSYFSTGASGQSALPPIPGLTSRLITGQPQSAPMQTPSAPTSGGSPNSTISGASCGQGSQCRHTSWYDCLCEGWENARRGPKGNTPATQPATPSTMTASTTPIAPATSPYAVATQPTAPYVVTTAPDGSTTPVPPPASFLSPPPPTPTSAPAPTAAGRSVTPSSPSLVPPPVIGDFLGSGLVHASGVAPGTPGAPVGAMVNGLIRGFKAAENQSTDRWTAYSAASIFMTT